MGIKIQTIKDIRDFLTRELKGAYPEYEIRAISDILIKKTTGITKLHQLYDNGFEVSDDAEQKIFGFAQELKTGKPVQYVIGETVFYNCRIKVDSSTLIPRQETEELVDLIISENKDYKGSITDFGSGSGCITIALAANLPQCNVTGVEISDDAIVIARENAVLNNVNVSFIKADIFNFDCRTMGKQGIIVSNPPYVRDSEKAQMNKNVLGFEPPLALFVTDSDPLVYYAAIIKLSDEMLLGDGRLYFEINEMMGSQLSTMLKSSGYTDIKIINDLNEKERIIRCRKNV